MTMIVSAICFVFLVFLCSVVMILNVDRSHRNSLSPEARSRSFGIATAMMQIICYSAILYAFASLAESGIFNSKSLVFLFSDFQS